MSTAPAATNGKASRPGPQRDPHPLCQHRADASEFGKTIALATNRPTVGRRPKSHHSNSQLPAVSIGNAGPSHIRSDPEKRTCLGASFEAADQLLQTQSRAGLVVLRPQAWRQVLEHQRDFRSAGHLFECRREAAPVGAECCSAKWRRTCASAEGARDQSRLELRRLRSMPQPFGRQSAPQAAAVSNGLR
jgi:hypothetical protein